MFQCLFPVTPEHTSIGSNEGGLSGGAIAGIVVAAFVALLLLAGAVVVIVWLYKRRNRARTLP